MLYLAISSRNPISKISGQVGTEKLVNYFTHAKPRYGFRFGFPQMQQQFCQFTRITIEQGTFLDIVPHHPSIQGNWPRSYRQLHSFGKYCGQFDGPFEHYIYLCVFKRRWDIE